MNIQHGSWLLQMRAHFSALRRTFRAAVRSLFTFRLPTAVVGTETKSAARATNSRSHNNRIIVLLPVRNGENDLPAYFSCVSRFADGVIALDDGSTDATAEILQQERLVLEVLQNPRRESYIGWNDFENRSRLLDACRKHRVDWVFQLDADEILDDSDAAELRRFIESESIPNVAYGFLRHRMIDDLQQFDKAGLWVYRLFLHQAGQKLPSRILHFEPVPTSIPRDRWVRTRFRIKHRSGMTEAKRWTRYEKYLLVDPEKCWQSSYENL